MRIYRKAFWQESWFLIPLVCFLMCLILLGSFWGFGIGKPTVAVAIALDLSSSTYEEGGWLGTDSVMTKEVQAVQAYLQENSKTRFFAKPNQVQVFGFANTVKSLTNGFQSNNQQVQTELIQSIQNTNLPQEIGTGTNLDNAIQFGISSLEQAPNNYCRELLLVSDGNAPIDPNISNDAINNDVTINSIILAEAAPDLQRVVNATGGQLISGDVNSLKVLFIDEFFAYFNNNLKWIFFWLGLAWIFLWWTLMLPLDRLLQYFKVNMNVSGRFSLLVALFWTGFTLSILAYIGLPFVSQC